MRAFFLPVILASSLLSGCDVGMLLGDKAKIDAGLSYNMVEFKQQGGDKCPADATDKTPDTLCARVKFTYPVISSDSKPELADSLNTFIRQQMLDVLNEGEEANGTGSAQSSATTLESFATGFIEEFKQDPNTFSNWQLERNVDVFYSNDKLMTLKFEEFGFTGGAHPFNGSRYSVINLETGKQLELDDLLNPSYEAALNVEGEKAFREARDLPEGSSLEEQGFTFENNVFMLNDNFGVSKEGLNFIFNSYEVAAYAVGPTELSIPFEDIQALIRADGPLGIESH